MGRETPWIPTGGGSAAPGRAAHSGAHAQEPPASTECLASLCCAFDTRQFLVLGHESPYNRSEPSLSNGCAVEAGDGGASGPLAPEEYIYRPDLGPVWTFAGLEHVVLRGAPS